MSEQPRVRQNSAPLFVERHTYRRRRLMDAARFVPVVGLGLWWVPLLWGQAESGPVHTSSAGLYIFGVWSLLIAVGLFISLRLKTSGAVKSDQDTDR